MFIVTNGLSHIQKLRIVNSKIEPYITDILISEDAGCTKPGKKFFDYSIKRAGISNLSEIIIVGDSLITDVFGGNEYGIDTCWFNSKGKINKLKIQPKFEIRELNELLNII
ncbi:HAD-IA family hydrolase [Clostridium guangxiense]|uniref:HAD-IA family hydrolase n=1 Tax=Clostridium guangxiense TaxID=1662055 RepID=UPI0038B2746E